MVMKYLSLVILLAVLLSCGGRQQGDDQPDTTALSPATSSETPESNFEVFRKRFEQGIDFAATGNEPFWRLDIDFDGAMHFSVLDGPEISAPTPEGVKALDADVTRYAAETDQGSLVAQLIRQECIDNMSGARSEYTVRVEILAAANGSPSTYEGCGRYLADMMTNGVSDSGLHGKWTLESINNNVLNKSDFMKGLPELKFDMVGKKVTGHSGCNNISGAIEVKGHTIDFKPMISTKMACPGMEFEHAYLKHFTGEVGYRVEAGKLLLLVSPDSTFTYTKTN